MGYILPIRSIQHDQYWNRLEKSKQKEIVVQPIRKIPTKIPPFNDPLHEKKYAPETIHSNQRARMLETGKGQYVDVYM